MVACQVGAGSVIDRGFIIGGLDVGISPLLVQARYLKPPSMKSSLNV